MVRPTSGQDQEENHARTRYYSFGTQTENVLISGVEGSEGTVNRKAVCSFVRSFAFSHEPSLILINNSIFSSDRLQAVCLPLLLLCRGKHRQRASYSGNYSSLRRATWQIFWICMWTWHYLQLREGWFSLLPDVILDFSLATGKIFSGLCPPDGTVW